MIELNQSHAVAGTLAQTLKNWLMVFLTLIFVVLYGLALLGKLKPLADASMVSRLEPLIFIIIGYYFGRLPGEENEKSLKEEIGRHIQKADAAQAARETASRSRDVLDEKIKNARMALGKSSDGGGVGTALNILSS